MARRARRTRADVESGEEIPERIPVPIAPEAAAPIEGTAPAPEVQVSAPEAPVTPEQPTPAPPATPTQGPVQPGPSPDHLVEGSATGQTFEKSFARPGSREAAMFQPRERLNLFRSLPQFRSEQEQGGMKLTPEMAGGGMGVDYGSLEGAAAGLSEEEMRRHILRRMF